MTQTISHRKMLVFYLLGLLLVLLLWHQVFVMTGVLWWNAPAGAHRVAAPAPLRLPSPNTGWVNLQAFLQTHPEWNPQ